MIGSCLRIALRIVAIGVTTACGSSTTPEPQPVSTPPPPTERPATVRPIVQNASFSVEIPDGYRDVTTELATGIGGAVILLKGKVGVAGAETITFVPTQHHPEDHLDDATQCDLGAKEMSDRLKAERPTSSIVSAPAGKTCQITLQYPAQHATVISTVLEGPSESWVMTCTFLMSDADAPHQCDATRRTVTFRRR